MLQLILIASCKERGILFSRSSTWILQEMILTEERVKTLDSECVTVHPDQPGVLGHVPDKQLGECEVVLLDSQLEIVQTGDMAQTPACTDQSAEGAGVEICWFNYQESEIRC